MRFNNPSSPSRNKLGVIAVLSLALGLSSCGGGGGTGIKESGGPFYLLETQPANNGRLFLNQTVKFFFSNPVDLNSANFNSVAFQAFDAGDNPASLWNLA